MASEGQKAEIRQLNTLIKQLSSQVCMPVKNFLQWQKDLRLPNEQEGMCLMEWRKKQRICDQIFVPKTKLMAFRLTHEARGVVRGIIGFFFDLFDRDKVPQSSIDPKDIHVRRDMVVWVANLTVQQSTPDLRRQAIDNLKAIVLHFVGNNLPADVAHLINKSLEEAKTNLAMKAAVLMHPSLHMNCKMAAFAACMYQLFRRASMTADRATTQRFLDIASFITVAQPYWHNRIYSDARGSDWPDFLNLTYKKIQLDEGTHMPTAIGPLLLMRHAVIHYKRAIDAGVGLNGLDLDKVENQLYVLFPTYMSEFVHNMVSLGFFTDHWMK